MFMVLLGCAIGLGEAQAADSWTDISDAQWVAVYGVTAQQAGTVADGFPDGTFRPYAAVTRGQFAKMSVQGLNVETRNPSTPSFSDVPRTHLFFPYVEAGSFAGIMGGFSDGTFRPDRPIERQQSNSILGRYLAAAEIGARGGIRGDVLTYPSLSAWYMAEGNVFYLTQFDDQGSIADVHRAATAYLVFRSVVHGSDGKLTPTAPLSRAQAVALVLRALEATTQVTTPPLPPTDLATIPLGPANDARPFLTGQTLVDGHVAIYDAFGGATTELMQGTADSTGHFSIRLPALLEGLHSFTAKVKDASGVISASSAPVLYRLDLTDPAGEITAPEASGGVASRGPDFTVSASDEGAGLKHVSFEYRAAGSSEGFVLVSIDSVTLDGLYQAVWGDRSLPDGAYEFRAVVTDLAGNETLLGPVDVVVDLLSPTVELQAPSAGVLVYTQSRSPVFVAAAVDDSAGPGVVSSGVARVDFFYRLKADLPVDPAVWTATDFTLLSSNVGPGYSAAWGATSLADGRYVFAVRSVDGAGNVSALDTQEVVVDNAPPGAPTGVSATDNDNVQPGIDGRDFTVGWTPSGTAETVSQLIYILPAGTTLQLYAAAHIAVATYANNTTAAWTGTSAVTTDSTGASFNPDLGYHVWVVAEDAAGNRSASSAVLWPAGAPAAPTGVQAADADSAFVGTDGRDFTVWWTKSTSPDVLSHRIYILPSATALKLSEPGAHVPAASPTDDSVPWVGGDAIHNDSSGAPLTAVVYTVYVVATDDDGRSSWSSASMTPAAE